MKSKYIVQYNICSFYLLSFLNIFIIPMSIWGFRNFTVKKKFKDTVFCFLKLWVCTQTCVFNVPRLTLFYRWGYCCFSLLFFRGYVYFSHWFFKELLTLIFLSYLPFFFSHLFFRELLSLIFQSLTFFFSHLFFKELLTFLFFTFLLQRVTFPDFSQLLFFTFLLQGVTYLCFER